MGCWGVLSSPIGCNLQNWSNFTLWAARCNKGEREDLLEKGEEVHILITHQGGISFDIHPSLHEKEILTASGEHIIHLHERGWYLRMPSIRRILPTPTMQCTNAVITASAVKKMGTNKGLDNGMVKEGISRYFSTKKWRNRSAPDLKVLDRFTKFNRISSQLEAELGKA